MTSRHQKTSWAFGTTSQVARFLLLLSSCTVIWGFAFNAGFWKPTYTVRYDANGSTSGTSPGDQYYTNGETVTVAANTGSLARTGYTFGGWNTLANGSGTNYTAGSGTFPINTPDVILYATWNVNSYTVTYNANGATSGTVPAASNFNFGTTVTAAANSGTLQRTGFIFGGWNTAADGSGTTYAAGSGSFSMGAANMTLFARWDSICSQTSYNHPAPTWWPLGGQIVNIRLNSQARTFLKVAPGAAFNLTFDLNIYADGYCPGCYQQFYVGYAGQLQTGCFGFSRGSTFRTLYNNSANFTAPTTTGPYYLSTNGGWNAGCPNATMNTDSSAFFALICVQ